MRIKVNVAYEYDVEPAHYPEGSSPTEMAQLDFETDVTALLDGESYEIAAREIKPYTGPKVSNTSASVSSGAGCKRCGCRRAAPGDDHCAPCREKVG